MKNKGRGRPTKFNKDRAEAVIEAVRQGCTLRAAAAKSNIHVATLCRWRNELCEFREALEIAEGVAEGMHTGVLQKAAFGWVETTIIEREGPGGVYRSVKRMTRFLPQYSLLWLRTRRPQDWAQDRNGSGQGQDAGPGLAAVLADIARQMGEPPSDGG